MSPEVIIGLLVVVALVGAYFYTRLEKEEDLADVPPSAPAPEPVVEDAPVKKAPAKRAPKTEAKAPAKAPAKKPATKKAPAKPSGKKKLTVAK
jgi:septal ring-binding cell division protein DamX